MYKDFRSGKKSIDGVTVSHVSRVCWISSISSPCSPEMNVQVPKWAMFGSLHLTIFLPANTLYISLHSLKLGNQLTSCMGWGFPWISHGFAGAPWAQQAGATAAGGTGSRYNERGAALCTAPGQSGERWPTCYHLIFQVWNTHGDHTHTHAHIIYSMYIHLYEGAISFF